MTTGPSVHLRCTLCSLCSLATSVYLEDNCSALRIGSRGRYTVSHSLPLHLLAIVYNTDLSSSSGLLTTGHHSQSWNPVGNSSLLMTFHIARLFLIISTNPSSNKETRCSDIVNDIKITSLRID